jgi:hypothetical protein
MENNFSRSKKHEKEWLFERIGRKKAPRNRSFLRSGQG